jgi:hypothetical protein
MVKPYLFSKREINELVLSWYTNYANGFRLQSATNLAASGWVDVTNNVVVTNALNQVRIPIDSKAAYFRLKH